MKWVRNARKGAKMWSNQSAALAAVLALQEALPIWKPLVPEGIFAVLGAVAATGAIFLRLIDQGLDDEAPESEDSGSR